MCDLWVEEPNVIIHNSMVSACEKSHAWQNALQMDDIDLPGFNAAISACEKAEEWQQSLRLLWSLPISADVVSCNAALSACNSGAVVRRLGSIKAVDGPYGKLCEKRQKWQIALQLLQSFPVPRSSTSCNAAIAACQTCWPVAMELLTSFSFWRLQRDEVSFSSAIAVCENWQLALSLLVEMLQKALQPNLLSYNSVMFSCLRHGHWSQALELISAAELADVQMDSAAYGHALWAFRLGCCSRAAAAVMSFSERRNTGPVDLASAFEAPPPPAKANRAGLKPLGAVEPREFQSNWYPTPADTALSDDDAMEQLAKKGKAPNATVAAAQVQVKPQKTKKRKGKRSKEKDAEETEQDSQPAHGTNSEDEEKDGLGPAGAGLMSEAEVQALMRRERSKNTSASSSARRVQRELEEWESMRDSKMATPALFEARFASEKERLVVNKK
eukprot:g25481.t1